MRQHKGSLSRVLIDEQQTDVGSDIKGCRSVRYEWVLQYGTKADYVLCDRNGRSTAVLEAKRASINPVEGLRQKVFGSFHLGLLMMLYEVATLALALCSGSASLTFAQAPTRPDPSRTPGAINPEVTQATIYETICARSWTRTVRPPEEYTYRLKREQLRDWSYEDQQTRDYEEDHLIPLELGGSPTSPQNLWPEPWAGPWNADVKDRLENYLHDEVCADRIPLDEAQREIAGDWTAAYKEYLGDPAQEQ